MITFIRRTLARLLRVEVPHYKVKAVKFQELQDTLHRQMANELGMIWPQTRRKL